MDWAADWRVYLHLPAAHFPDDIDSVLKAALETGAIGAVELPYFDLSVGDAVERTERFRQIIQPAGVPLIGFGQPPTQCQAQLDGARFADTASFDQRSKSVGLAGITVSNNRDAAMEAGGKEPDFVYLPHNPDFISWWAEVITVPCVAPTGAKLADSVEMLRGHPDMLAMGDVAWNHPDGAAGAIMALATLVSAD